MDDFNIDFKKKKDSNLENLIISVKLMENLQSN